MKRKANFGDYIKDKLEYFVALLAFLLFFSLSLTDTGVKYELGMYEH